MRALSNIIHLQITYSYGNNDKALFENYPISTVAQKGHTCKLKMLLQTKNFTPKLKMLLQIKNRTCKLKIAHAN